MRLQFNNRSGDAWRGQVLKDLSEIVAQFNSNGCKAALEACSETDITKAVVLRIASPEGKEFCSLVDIKYDSGLPFRQLLNTLILPRMIFDLGDNDKAGPIISFYSPKPESCVRYKFSIADEQGKQRFMDFVEHHIGAKKEKALLALMSGTEVPKLPSNVPCGPD